MYSVATNTTNAELQNPSKDVADSPSPEEQVEDAVSPEESGKTQSRSQMIRAKLRDQEKRLSSLVRVSSSASKDGSTTGFLSQYAKVEDNLKKVEDEKSELEQELEKLRNSTFDDDFLKEKMEGIQEGFDKQVEKIQDLQQEINAKDLSIKRLRDEIVHKLRRIVELEFDLETHQVHYTDYAAEQFRLGEEALEEIRNGASMSHLGNESMASVGSTSSGKSVSPRRAQKLISKLLSDLDDLEARYKADMLDAGVKNEQLVLVNEEYQTKLQMLENRLDQQDENNSQSSEDEQGVLAFDDTLAWRKRAELYEARCAVLERNLTETKSNLNESIEKYEAEARRSALSIDRLEHENKILLGNASKNSSTDQLAIQSKIRDAYNEVARLDAESEIKDRKLATLKKEVKKLRLRGIRDGNAESKGFSSFDAELLRENDNIDAISKSTPGSADPAYVQRLQMQFQEAQQALVKKDQELVIERAKSASTAAGLLARITELSKPHPRTPSRSPRSAAPEEDRSECSDKTKKNKTKKPKSRKGRFLF